MKKAVAVFLLCVLVSAGANAQLSAGGGMYFDYSGGNGLKTGSEERGYDIFNIGGHGFIDITYLEIDLYLLSGAAEPYNSISNRYYDDRYIVSLGVSLLGKFPFKIKSVYIFPLLGLSYNMVLSTDIDDNKKNLDFNQIGGLAGFGVDFNITDTFFIRPSILFQIRLPSEYWKKEADRIGGSTEATMGIGPVIKVGFGHRFK